jgi:hypothetical protein
LPRPSDPPPSEDPRLASAWLLALSRGQLSKAWQVGSVAFDLALACLGTALFGPQRPSPPSSAPAAPAPALAAAGDQGLIRDSIGQQKDSALQQKDSLKVDRRLVTPLSAVQKLPPDIMVDLMQVRGRKV